MYSSALSDKTTNKEPWKSQAGTSTGPAEEENGTGWNTHREAMTAL